MLLVGGLSLQQRQQLAAPGSAVAVPSGRSSRASTSSTTFGKNSSNGGVQSASAELDSDLLEFDENFASENHGRNSKNSAFQPRSESSLTSGRIFFNLKKNLGLKIITLNFRRMKWKKVMKNILTASSWNSLTSSQYYEYFEHFNCAQ